MAKPMLRVLLFLGIGAVAGLLVDAVTSPRGGSVAQPAGVRGEGAASLAAAIRELDPDEIVSVLPRDTIRSIVMPRVVAADEGGIGDHDLVVGVEIGEDRRAYPLKALAGHEIVDDVVGGHPIAVTWCPLCFTAIVYDREVDGQRLTFGVSGKLYRRSLIMYDQETGSLWSHFLGTAVRGPLKGKQLEVIPARLTDWRTWRREHPDTRALPGPAVDDFYTRPYTSSETGVLGARRPDARLGPNDVVLAVLRPAVKAYALRDLARVGRVRDTIAGKQVEVVYDRGSRSASAFLLSGRERTLLPSTPVYWFAWVAFFPRAPLWRHSGP